MFLRISWFFKKVKSYIKNDMKEIIFPSPLPDPPGTLKSEPLSWKKLKRAIKEGTLDYIDSWRKIHIREVHLQEKSHDTQHYSLKLSEIKDNHDKYHTLSLGEELIMILKQSANDIRPGLQKLYYTRAKVLHNTIASFTKGYKHGLIQVKKQIHEGKN